MFFLFFIGNFDIFYCSNYFILFFIIVGFIYFVSQFRVNSINPISSRLSLSVKQLKRWRKEQHEKKKSNNNK